MSANATLEDLVGLPLDGMTGLDDFSVRFFKHQITGVYHLDYECVSMEGQWVADHRSFPNIYYQGLGSALKKMCPVCLGKYESLHAYSTGGEYLLSTTVRALLYIIERHAEIFNEAKPFEGMSAAEVHQALLLLTPASAETYPQLESEEELYHERVLQYLPWFENKHETFIERVQELKKKALELDTETQVFYATEALSAQPLSLPGRPQALESIREAISKEAALYAQDATKWLVVLSDDNDGSLERVFRTLYDAPGGNFMVLSTAALDYLSVKSAEHIWVKVKVEDGLSDSLLETVAGLYDPFTFPSPLSTLPAAYAAAVSV